MKRILVTGATGYIGGRLVPKLLEAGYKVVAVGRSLRKLKDRLWAGHEHVQLFEADASDPSAICEAMQGCWAAYYLIHSMESAGAHYSEVDRQLADSFGSVGKTSDLSRIIYLGGLGETGPGLSQHLSSRREVEHALGRNGVPVTTLRAAMIIGSGSASFETLRYLVERLPIMVTPKWVRTRCQPISVRDVLALLAMVLAIPETVGQTYDIGGSDSHSYKTIMNIMARALGMRSRLILPVPVLTPRLSSAWIHFVTPISHKIARPLAEGLRNEVVCREENLKRLTNHKFLSTEQAIQLAIQAEKEGRVLTKWSDAAPMPGDPDWAGGTLFKDIRKITIRAPIQDVFGAIRRMGGKNGYYAANWLWALRGAMDRLVGGPGLRRGRRHQEDLNFGDAVDFWRVSEIHENKLLELRAEMKLPGVAILKFELNEKQGELELTQTAQFKPKGLFGILYWYSVIPLHGVVFSGMMRGIKKHALKGEAY